MRVLGIDPGSIVTGYGVIEEENNRLLHIDNGGIFTDSNADYPQRLKEIYERLKLVVKQFSPEVMAVEDIFYARNARAALKLAHCRGVILLCAVHSGIDVCEYTPLEIKQAVVGYGRAGKKQVQRMVKTLLNLPEIAQIDASDALAVAICHIHSFRTEERLKG
ncbi:MAG: crossover junction endodeoxyribonuclease RuvC [Deltaproteobacteria bacterium]|nr:MAG: crossover junction endodeoxyribonuclease RuvC [Deltaproteobacteria bacterium]